jgi:hypothetical protein
MQSAVGFGTSDRWGTFMGSVSNVEAQSAGLAQTRLATLAVLRAHWEAGKESYVDTFIPFALEAVRLEGGNGAEVAEVQARVATEFGIEIPQAALRTILRRAVQKGLGDLHQGTFEPNLAHLGRYDTAGARVSARREQDSLVRGLVTYAASEHELVVSVADAASALASYVDRHATSVLAASRGSEVEQVDELGPTDFVIASFVARVLDREPEVAVYLEHVVVGSMLASALYAPDLARVEDPFNCDVYLDSPALIDALGHAGETPARAARESVGLLREAGAKLKCFDHTAVEIERKLCSVAEGLRDSRRRAEADTIVGNAMKRKLSAADLERASGRVRADLKRQGVEVVTAPEHSDTLGIDEVAAESILEERLGHSRKATIRFDLDSLTGVHRLRRGRPQHRLETCVAIFATPHGKLVAAARQIYPTRNQDAPVAVSLTDLVTLAWLKKPRSAPDLPRLRIAADCFAAIQPSAGLIRRYVEEASKLEKAGAISADDLYELRYGVESRRILMQRTLGSPAAVDAEKVREVLAERDRQIEAEARSVAERDAKAARSALEVALQARHAAEDEVDRLQARVGQLEADGRAQRHEIEKAQAAEGAEIRRRAALKARWIARFLFSTLVVAVLVFTLLTAPYAGPRAAKLIGATLFVVLPAAIRWVIAITVCSVAIGLVVLSLGWGGSAASVVRRVEAAIETRLARRYRRRALFVQNGDEPHDENQ